MSNRHQPEATVLPVHFEDRSGPEFERLGFAYLLRAFDWKTIDWYGQLGGDGGRDIWAVRKTGETECFQCANHRALKFKKAEEDLATVVAGPNGVPTKFTLIRRPDPEYSYPARRQGDACMRRGRRQGGCLSGRYPEAAHGTPWRTRSK